MPDAGAGRELVEAEKKTKNIIQVGMQRRSYDLYLEGRDIVASGQLGDVRMVRSWWLNNYLGGRRATKLEGPLDWEQWQGPAPRRPWIRTVSATGGTTPITPAASWPTRARTYSTAYTC